MSETTAPAAGGFKPKKSVALSGTAAGNTALCTVGRSGNDLHYRGYDILDVAAQCEFEEIAHLLVHGKLPTTAELAAYKTKLKSLRGLPAAVKTALEQLPPSSHPMDVMRTGVSVLGCVKPEKDDHNHAGARDIADKLMACLGSMLLYWYHYAYNGKVIEVDESDEDSIGGHFLELLHQEKPKASWVKAMHTSLVLYGRTRVQRVDLHLARNRGYRLGYVLVHRRRHRRSAWSQAWRRQRGRLRNPEALRQPRRSGSRHQGPRREEGSRDRLRPPGLHDRRSAQQGHQAGGQGSLGGSRQHQDVRHRRASRNGDVGHQEDVSEPRLVFPPSATTSWACRPTCSPRCS